MGLRDLTTASMVSITQAWVDPERERSIFACYPRLAPWLADIEAAHAGLHEVQDASKSPELVALNERASFLDAEHDRKARGLYDVLTGLASLSDDRDRAASILTLREELFPNGLMIVRRSYLDQAGEASLLESRLGDGSRELLRNIVVDGTPLVMHVDRWLGAARELGEVEAVRVQLAKSEKASSATSLGKARQAWVSVVNSVLFVIERESLTDSDRRRLLEPLDTALAKAEAKKKARGEDAAESETGAE